MIGNRFIDELFNSNLDDDTCFNVLLEKLKNKDLSELVEFKKPKTMSDEEKAFEVKCVSLIHYFCNLYELDTPKWVYNNDYYLENPWFATRKLSDVDFVKMVFSNPFEMGKHNVFFDLRGLERI